MPTKQNQKASATVAPQVETSVFENDVEEVTTKVRERRTYKPRYFASVKMREIAALS